MSLRPEPAGPIPEETVRVARAAFPHGNVYMQMRDVLGTLYDDASFAPLFAVRGRPVETPWRLALVTVMQFAEGLSDRQAAEAVRARIDWKYALGLALSDPGFDFSVLCEFRARLIAGAMEQVLLDAVLSACKARGLLKTRGRQRTDSTQVLGALRVMNRLERVAETLRAALNAVATVAPAWLRQHALPEWEDRYGRRIEDYRLPKGKEARTAYGQQVGADGQHFLATVADPLTPPQVAQLEAVQILRRLWVQQYMVMDGRVHLRDPQDMPPAAAALESPYEPEARFSTKRELHWTGYKVHLTESCDEDQPHVLTQVETTMATVPDVEALATIQQGLAQAELLPGEQLVDAGYMRGSNLVASQAFHGIALIGPVAEDHQWQAKAKNGYAIAQFAVDWAAKVVSCPQGQQSVRWSELQTAQGPQIHVTFAVADCTPCPARVRCTRAARQPRALTLQPHAEHEAIQAARARQRTETFTAAYAARAGCEGTLSQAVRAFGLRQARYRGLAKTHLQHLATAAALNVHRLATWLDDMPRAQTRQSAFATAMHSA
jgi:transposase